MPSARGMGMRVETHVFRWLPALVCMYVTVAFPLALRWFPSEELESRIEHRIFWPTVAGLALIGCARRIRSLRLCEVPPSLWLLCCYLGFALCSLIWSAAPDIGFRRLVQQILVVSAVAGPVLFYSDTIRLISALGKAFAFGCAVNLVAVAIIPPTELGFAGVFTQKNTLGQFAGITLLFVLLTFLTTRSLLERGLSIFSVLAASVLLALSQSKTSLGLALACPLFSLGAVALARACRVTPFVIVCLLIPFVLLSAIPLLFMAGKNFGDLSLLLFSDTTFTGRTYIWAFAVDMIERRSLLGWGYQSFWLIGPDAVSVRAAPGFVSSMPHAHNGYLDVMLELGAAGLAILAAVLMTALASAGSFLSRPMIATASLGLLLFIVCHNLLESSWFRGSDLPWVMFLVIAAQRRSYPRPEMVARSIQISRTRLASWSGLAFRLPAPSSATELGKIA